MPDRAKIFHGHDLQRFLDAQETTFQQALSELARGRKRSHWMWFIFPQIRGLGSSQTAQRFAISGLEEAAVYLRDPVLGVRLRECTALVNAVQAWSVHDIFGYPDDLKFHSSVTLFFIVVQEFDLHAPEFAEALSKHFGGRLDEATLRQVGK